MSALAIWEGDGQHHLLKSRLSLCFTTQPSAPPSPPQTLTHRGVEPRLRNVHQSDLRCPHRNSGDLWTRETHNTCDTFNLPIEVFNVCLLRGFLSLRWMNQSVTAREKRHAQPAVPGPRLVAGCEPPTSEEPVTRWVLRTGGMNEQQSLYSHSLHSNLSKEN